jgi:tetratricopeptide (TPR) repeat protein
LNSKSPEPSPDDKTVLSPSHRRSSESDPSLPPDTKAKSPSLTKEDTQPTVDFDSQQQATPTAGYSAVTAAKMETGDFSSDTETSGSAKGVLVQALKKASEPQIPKSIGQYDIQSVLGRGGMGVVYLAYQRKLKRNVALKMVLAGQHASEQQIARFEAEARAVAQLQHPNIVQVFEVGHHDDLPYIALEYVDGTTLTKRLDGKPLAPREAASLIQTICHAMQYAHDRGILHRDLKPSNILVSTDGISKITDFGLAKQLDDEEAESTRTGAIMGTPSYMSPEQAQGLTHAITPLSDQYSLGAMLYELLTGRPPFLGTKAFDTLSQVIHKEPIPPCQLQGSLPVDIDTICLKSLHKNPEKRYASCQQLAEDLARFLRGEPIVARPVSSSERLWRWCKRNPKFAIPTAIATFFIFATTAVSLWAWQRTAAQALVITQERDTANSQRIVAIQNANTAQQEKENAEKQKAEAEKQKILADEAKVAAEANQKLAEKQTMLALSNMQVIVTTIDDQLRNRPGMSKSRAEIFKFLDKQWNELDLQLAGGLQGQAVPTQMAVRFRLAEIFNELGQLAEAKSQFEKLYEFGHQRVLVKERSDASRQNLALICARLAKTMYEETNDPLPSLKLLEESRDLFLEIRRIPRPQPGSPSLSALSEGMQRTLLLFSAYELSRGNVKRAEDLYRELLAEAETNEARKSDKDWTGSSSPEALAVHRNFAKQNLQIAQVGIARCQATKGDIDGALTILDKSIQINREQLAAMPATEASRARVFAMQQVAQLLQVSGRYCLRFGYLERGTKAMLEAVDLYRDAYESDPALSQSRQDYGNGLHYAGVLFEARGMPKDALVQYERARVIRQSSIDLTPADSAPNPADQAALALTLSRMGAFEPTLALLSKLEEQPKASFDLSIDIARCYAQLYRQSQEDDRQRFLDRALTMLERVPEQGLLHPFLIDREPDFDSIRQEVRFQKVVEQLGKLQP